MTRKNPGKCGWCGAMQLRRHPDARKAADKLKYCSACGMTQSPHATVKGSYAYLDKQTGRIVTGVRKTNPGPDQFSTADGRTHRLKYSSAIGGGDRAVIRDRVGRMHVSTPDEDVRQDIFWRIPKKHRDAQPKAVEIAMRYAVECHHKNQKLYRAVMSGRL